MSDVLAPSKTVTFTITSVPVRPAQRKTIARLMRMQPHVRKTLEALQLRRAKQDNKTYIRAGVEWTNRAKATRVTRVEKDATFTLRITPQIMPDIASVSKFLSMKAG